VTLVTASSTVILKKSGAHRPGKIPKAGLTAIRSGFGWKEDAGTAAGSTLPLYLMLLD